MFDRAVPPNSPASPQLPVNVIVGSLVGLLLALVIVGGREYLDDSLRTQEDVEALTGLATLGSIEQFPARSGRPGFYSLVTILHPHSRSSESFRTLRTNLDFASIDGVLRTILVASSVPGEGKTTVAANLAVAFAESGRRTILVDSDMRQPGVHDFFRIENGGGLTMALRSEGSAIEAVLVSTEVPRLRVLPAGVPPPNPAELLGSMRMRTAIERLKELADVVVFDSPPLGLVTDGAVLASLVDGTLLVVRAGRTRRAAVRRGWEALERVKARTLGVTLNGLRVTVDDSYAPYYGRPLPTLPDAPSAAPSAQPDSAGLTSGGAQP